MLPVLLGTNYIKAGAYPGFHMEVLKVILTPTRIKPYLLLNQIQCYNEIRLGYHLPNLPIAASVSIICIEKVL